MRKVGTIGELFITKPLIDRRHRNPQLRFPADPGEKCT